ncbi:MAG: hypothetical protein KA717_19355 [Woronichinia naegeliana WA131]|jgi:hypothetical protein|uniref:Uncharacterized protein n=1 Tax=Woronichinia naegeliana WA131 TaxID=2824559 RepID=A0A977PYT2_9CYAN|nr:MAG: hypothetical protein KA717_19355 [Woronichinia naegeliana WA131]
MATLEKNIHDIAREAREWVSSEEGQKTIEKALKESKEVLSRLHQSSANNAETLKSLASRKISNF